ncbi:protein usg [Candidatus Nomurabacteria bacterium]|nr:protein usg [Candidatus Nomurabacteria bacterium]MCB9819157.1 protein usg [Candidatus Nomurabacteria bacterium]
MHTDTAFRESMAGYGQTTAHIYYRLPDTPSLLGEFIWQFYDLHPKFPRLQKFLQFWETSIEAPINSVVIAHSHLIRPAEIRMVDAEFRLH